MLIPKLPSHSCVLLVDIRNFVADRELLSGYNWGVRKEFMHDWKSEIKQNLVMISG